MKHRFHKKEIPWLYQSLHGNNAREYYWISHKQERGYPEYTYQQDRVSFGYERAAHMGDDWAQHGMAHILLYDPVRFPEALAWFHRSIRAGNVDAWAEVERKWDYIHHTIFTYNTHYHYEYGDIEVRCALMTDLCLLRLGKDRWEDLDLAEKERRVTELCHIACLLLGIDDIALYFKDVLPPIGKCSSPQGIAYLPERKIEIARSFFGDLERVIQVLFHELGHHVVYRMMYKDPYHLQLLKRYGLSQEQIEKWANEEIGNEISLFEEDPDTLSYGVWWTYLLYFADPK